MSVLAIRAPDNAPHPFVLGLALSQANGFRASILYGARAF